METIQFTSNFFLIARQPWWARHPLPLIEVSRSHLVTPHSASILRTSHRPSKRPLPDTAQHSQEKIIYAPWVAFEPAISASDRPQTQAEDHAATGIDPILNTVQ